MTENKKVPINEDIQTTNIVSYHDFAKINSEYVKKDSFILYADQQEIFENLSDEEAGKLVKGIFQYTSGNEPKFNDLLKLVFIPIRQQLDRNAQKYTEIKEKRRMAGSKGAKQRLANQANANFVKQTQANQADNDNDNVYLSKDKYIDEYLNKNSNDKKFKIPSVEEIKTYCLERKNNIDAQRFWDYYQSNGWHVGKNKMKDWKACIRTWEKNTQNKKQKEDLSNYDNYNPFC